MEHYTIFAADLTLFDGGAPAGATPAGEWAQAAQAETKAVPGSGRRGKTGEEAKVVYGKIPQPPDGGSPLDKGAKAPAGAGEAGAAQQMEGPDAGGERQTEDVPAKSPTPEERKAQFEAMVSQDYKDLFDERVQGIINRRFKETKGLQSQLEAARPVLDMIARRYGVEDGDPAKLTQALEADDAYWEELAAKHGMTAQQYREFMKLQRENEALQREARHRRGEEAAQRQLAAWEQEAAGVRAEHPGFDLAAECRNPQFLGMLRAGVPVKHAYEVLHLGEIKQTAAAQAAQRTEKQVTETIRAKGARPAENGVSGASGITIKSDPSKLTRADRAEIARRVSRGEQIVF